MKRKGKGFTIVELVIVIAVIAILAAVLVPTFSEIIRKAQTNSDIQLVSRLNELLSVDEDVNGAKRPTMYDAVVVLEGEGYKVENLTPTNKAENNIVYDLDAGRFQLLGKDNKIILTDEKTLASSKALKDGSFNPNYAYRLFKMYDSIADFEKDAIVEGNEKVKFSIYASPNWTEENVLNLKVGFDAGKEPIVKSVSYVRTESTDGQDVVIRTNSFLTTLSVDAPYDTVKHYEYAAIVNVKQIAANSYDEFGTIGRLELFDPEGHIEAMSGSEIFCLMNASNETTTEDNKPIIQVNEGATVHTNDQNKNVASNNIAKDKNAGQTQGVANGHFEDCGAGRHTFSKLVVDSEHIYDVCTCCGYTLVSITDNAGTTIKQTKNVLVEETVNNVKTGRWIVDEAASKKSTTPIEKYTTEETITVAKDDTGKVTTVKIGNTTVDGQVSFDDIEKEDSESHITDNPEKTPEQEACKHNYVTKIVKEPTCYEVGGEGLAVHTCSKCGAYYNEVLPKAAHKYYDKVNDLEGYAYDGNEVCRVCGHERGNKKIAKAIIDGKTVIKPTLAELIALAPTDGTEFKITMLADDAAYITNDGGWAAWHIKKGQKIVIDLAGYTLKNLIKFPDDYYTGANPTVNGTTANNSVLSVAYGAELTIMDSSCINTTYDGTGMVFNQLSAGTPQTLWPSTNRSDDVIYNYGTFTLESGHLQCRANGAITYAVDSNANSQTNQVVFTMNGGKTSTTNTVNSVDIRLNCNSTRTGDQKAYINGGYISGMLWAQNANSNANYCYIEVTGGKIGTLSAGSSAQFHFNVIGGEYLESPADYLPLDKFARKGSDNLYHILPASEATDDEITAKIGDTKYFSFGPALSSVQSGETIVLYKDIVFDGMQWWKSENRSFTINLNGHSLSRVGEDNATYFFYNEGGTGVVTFENGTIDHVGSCTFRTTSTGRYILKDIVMPVGATLSTGAQIAEGYFTRIKDGKQYIIPESEATADEAIVRIGNKNYLSFEKALASANSGDTIELLKDIETGAPFVFNRDITISLDLCGYSITGTCNYLFKAQKGNITITSSVVNDDCGIYAYEAGCYYVFYNTGANLTLNNIYAEGYYYLFANNAAAAVTTVESGYYVGYKIAYSWSGNIYINGGSFYDSYNYWTSYYSDDCFYMKEGYYYTIYKISDAKYAVVYTYTPDSGDPYEWTNYYFTKEDADSQYDYCLSDTKCSNIKEYSINVDGTKIQIEKNS